MSGTPSREIFNPSKNYHGVQFVGGSGRRLFDFELNDVQSLLQQGMRNIVRGLSGGGLRLGLTGRMTPSGSSGTVLVEHGYIVVDGEVVNTKPLDSGEVGAPENLKVFEDAETTGTKIVFFDVSNTIIDYTNEKTADETIVGTGDHDLRDPTYFIDTAQRTKWNVVLTSQLGTTLPAAPTGHTYIALGTVTKTTGATTVAPETTNRLHNLTDMDAMYRALQAFFAVPLGTDGNPNWSALTGAPTQIVWLDNSNDYTFPVLGVNGTPVNVTQTVPLPPAIPPEAKAVLFKIQLLIPDTGTGHNGHVKYTLSTTGGVNSVAATHFRDILGSIADPHMSIQPDTTEQVWMDMGTFTIHTTKESGSDSFTLKITPIAYMVS